jgi:hypothetical protein
VLLEEGDVELPDASAPPPSDEMTAEQLKSYLENLRPEDFGKFSM